MTSFPPPPQINHIYKKNYLPITVVTQAYPGNVEMCPDFPPAQAALLTAAAGDKGIWVVWCSSDEVRLRQTGGKSSLKGLNNVRIYNG